MGVEIRLRWGATLVDVLHVERAYTLGDTPLVAHGMIVAPPVGSVGPIAYELAQATRAAPVPRPQADGRLVPYLVVAVAAHVAIAMWALATPAAPSGRADAKLPRPTHRAKLGAATIEPHVVDGRDDRGNANHGTSAAPVGPVGAAGTPLPAPPGGHVAIANTGEEAQLSRAERLEIARHAGILGSPVMSPASFASLLGADKVTSGFDEHSAEAVHHDGEAGGTSFGLGRTGVGPGGGDSNGWTIGYGTIGHHSDGTSQGHGWGGRGELHPATWSDEGWHGGDYAYVPNHHHLGTSRTRLDLCSGPDRARCSVDGVLDDQVVRRYVRHKLSQLSYCFEKELFQHPDPAPPALALTWSIAGDGSVHEVTATGASPQIAGCAADVIRTIEFPKGATEVTYVARFHLGPSG